MTMFLCLEGADGSGKSTLAAALAGLWGDRCLPIRFPGGIGDPVGARRRMIDLPAGHPDHIDILSWEGVGMMLQDLREGYSSHIAPALADGKIVLSDRWFYSGLVYQPDAARRLFRQLPAPDVVFWVDTPVAVCRDRLRDSADRLDSASLKYQKRIHRRYRRLLKGEGRAVRLDGEKPVRVLVDEVLAHIGANPRLLGLYP